MLCVSVFVCVDHKLSCSHLTNMYLNDALVKFTVKARLQLLACNSVLHVYYPDSCDRRCGRCGFFTETVSHILNGCEHNKTIIQRRHNRISNILTKAIADVNPHCEFVEDTIIKPSFLEPSLSEDDSFNFSGTRPDACFVNREERFCLIIEVAVPFDPFLNECYQSKFDKYLPLCQSIQELGYECKILIFVLGSLGSIHSRFVSGLRHAGIPPRRGRAIAKYCSIIAMIGSRIAWKNRCRET